MRDNKYAVAVFESCVGIGQYHLAVAPQARHHEFTFVHAAYLAQGVAKHGWVAHQERGYKSLIVIIVVTRLFVA